MTDRQMVMTNFDINGGGMLHTCALQGWALYPSRLTRQSGGNHAEITRTAQAINQLGISQVINTNKANRKCEAETNYFLPRKGLIMGKLETIFVVLG